MKHLVWELPVRVFHWSLAIVFTVAWMTQDDRTLYYHILAGYLFFSLILFRLFWGFKGEFYTRFQSFLFKPETAFKYLKNFFQPAQTNYIGHNPAGSWAIYLILTMAILISVSGLIVFGAEELHGPLKGLFSFETGDQFHKIHRWLAQSLLIIVIIHIFAVILTSFFHGENLIFSMLNGKKHILKDNPIQHVNNQNFIGILMLLVLSGFSIQWIISKNPEQSDFEFPYTLSINDLWTEECGACHLAYYPGLLPKRSWKKILDEQDEHFEEDLSLDTETINILKQYAYKQSSEPLLTEASWKIQHSIPHNQTPVRITDTRYWKHKHQIIPDTAWLKENIQGSFNCNACHFDAEEGWFDDGAITHSY